MQQPVNSYGVAVTVSVTCLIKLIYCVVVVPILGNEVSKNARVCKGNA